MALHAKAVPAEGRKLDLPDQVLAVIQKYDGGEGSLALTSDHPQVSDGGSIAFTAAMVWHWAMGEDQHPRKVEGEDCLVPVAAGANCIAALTNANGALQSVQLLIRITGKIASRASSSVGQIEPDEAFRKITGANRVFLRIGQIAGALQLPAVGERVEFQLAPNPERAGRLWAADVEVLEDSSLAKTKVGRTLSSESAGAAPASSAATAAAAGPPRKDYQQGCRIYVGLLPETAGWRELQEMIVAGGYGEIQHLQVPLDANGRRRGFAIIELDSPERVTHAIQRLELADIKGQQVVVRNDEAVVSHGTTRVFVGNLAPTVTWAALKGHIKAVDTSARAAVKIVTDPQGNPQGYGFIEFQTIAAADAAVWTLHNTVLEGKPLFLRTDVDSLDADGAEAAARREVHAKNAHLLSQLASWCEGAPPQSAWGWSDKASSSWVPLNDDGTAAGEETRPHDRHSLEWAQVSARLRRLIRDRMEISHLPQAYLQRYGCRLDLRALGFVSTRDMCAAIPSLAIESHGGGGRLVVAPAGMPAGGSRSGGGDRRDRDGGRDRGRERDRRGGGGGGGGGRDRRDGRRDDRSRDRKERR